MASRSGQAHVPSRRSSERRLILLAALIAIAAGLLVAVQPSSELDLDVLFPLTENSSIIERGPARQSVDTSEASVVRWFLLALATVVAVPLIVPRRLLRSALAASTTLIALFVAVSILRLGLLYLPVLAAQASGLWMLYRRSLPAT